MDNKFDKTYDCVTNESTVLHQFFLSYLQCLSCMNILCSLLKRGGFKGDLEIGISILCFRRHPRQVSLRPLHCDVKCFDI